jgi:hypothetical protein
MQCSCGGETEDRKSVSKKDNLIWKYSICKSCQRIDFDYLFSYDSDKLLLSGYQARVKYRELTKNLK